MKNNILGAMVIFFAVVACLLIIDDLSYSNETKETDFKAKMQVKASIEQSDLATTDLELED
ncbi:hypothetical protein [Winogradskyella immobilis]|uniref:Uncharacterized protein n=1 Tax=Winogradskyella immobilis TaxID=2816852 RepID=A0ABS8EMB3_9FLAO|nr:hypothetical protein [Winogradskyella immobilis]MCC1484353.1 hypothetical protein [Winogradskyella immobilis]MCG0016445.1 hypothetical protein [Winogradskyella immobilis]